MKNVLPVYPFDTQRLIGTITEVGPTYAKTNLPKAAQADGSWLHGNRMGAGEVGEFVVIECGSLGIFGRLISVKLPERERLSVEAELGLNKEAHPLGTIQLLSTISLGEGSVLRGISNYPRLGSKVFSAHPLLVKWIAESDQRGSDRDDPVFLDVAFLPYANDILVHFTPERLFGRHCAVLGATGGGKSWTLARLIEQTEKNNGKVLLFDATGEFHTFGPGICNFHIGQDPAPPSFSQEVVVPHNQLTEGDLFALFKPSGQTQAPKLRAAMKSLKLAKIAGAPLSQNGLIIKAKKPKQPYDNAYGENTNKIEGTSADFDVLKLPQQVNEECVWPSGGNAQNPDFTIWGNPNEQEKSYCVTLITRIDDMIHSPDLSCIFQSQKKPSLFEKLSEFLQNSEKRVMRISLKYLPFAHNAREIVANAIGRHLLTRGRKGDFRKSPILVFLDEADQFLDKSLGDENNRYPLDSFELIAKEGRKFCLNICLSTQRPRDVPEGVLSQMGTLIVHRLINEKDREVVEKASGDIDRSAAAFLPTLSPGQAVIIGVDFPIPLTVQMSRPQHEPDSRGPDYQTFWKTK